MPQYGPDDLSVSAKMNTASSGDIDKSAGVADLGFFVAPCNIRVRDIKTIVTSEVGATTAATVQVGTAASAGAVGSITFPATAALGSSTSGTISQALWPTGTVFCVDQTLATGTGVYCVQMDWTPEE